MDAKTSADARTLLAAVERRARRELRGDLRRLEAELARDGGAGAWLRRHPLLVVAGATAAGVAAWLGARALLRRGAWIAGGLAALGRSTPGARLTRRALGHALSRPRARARGRESESVARRAGETP